MKGVHEMYAGTHDNVETLASNFPPPLSKPTTAVRHVCTERITACESAMVFRNNNCQPFYETCCGKLLQTHVFIQQYE